MSAERDMDKERSVPVKKMADLLRHGATMLAQACPQCGSLLMKVGEDIYCATCDRKIVILKEGQQADSSALGSMIPELKETLVRKLRAVSDLVAQETNVDELAKLAGLMLLLLQSLQLLEKVK